MAPLVLRTTLLFPAATVCPSAVVNAGQEISKVPAARLPSARNTVSLNDVSAGPLADCLERRHSRNLAPNKKAARSGGQLAT